MDQKKLRVLFGVNGMGLGHLTHAYCLYPTLKKMYDVDILVSGLKQKNPFDFPVKHSFKGVSFVYKKGGVCWFDTIRQTAPISLMRDILQLDLSMYDFVLTDFEPISAWAAWFKKKPCLHVSHQASLFSKASPKPLWVGAPLWTHAMRLMAPSSDRIGFHFKAFESSIFGPLVKPDLDRTNSTTGDHILVYLSAFSGQEQLDFFTQFSDYQFYIFHNDFDKKVVHGHVTCHPIDHDLFRDKMLSCAGFISQAGFDSIAEVLYLNKPLVVMPIKKQFEQFCNAEALKKLNVLVLGGLNKDEIQVWLDQRPLPDAIVPLSPEALCREIDDMYYRICPRQELNLRPPD